MSWNYRIIDFGDHRALHEVHYDDAGKPRSYAAEPATFVEGADEREGIHRALQTALADATSKPALPVAEFGGGADG